MAINKNMISLKCLLFLFFGGMGCLFPFLPWHMQLVGMTPHEASIVSIVAPLVSIIGPVVVSPLADRLGGRSTGRPIRTMLSVAMLSAALFYGLLMAVPTVQRMEPRLPAVSFSCNEEGASVLQERCLQPSCTQLQEEKVGVLHLRGCRYSCEPDGITLPQVAGENTTLQPTVEPTTTEIFNVLEPEISETLPEQDYPDQTGDGTDEGTRRRRQAVKGGPSAASNPHICDGRICKVFTNRSSLVTVNATLFPVNETAGTSEKWCRYPLSEDFRCRIPYAELSSETGCKIVCDIEDPYTAAGSVLAQSECPQTIGDPVATFWSYLVLRSLGDMFITAALTLLDASIVIATRETSVGHGDVGHELVWGSLGYAVFAPSIGAILAIILLEGLPVYFLAFMPFIVLMVLSTLVVVFARAMPLSPPEWCWHARGMPLSGMARSATEIGAVSIVLVLLGAMWSAIHHFMPWETPGIELFIGVAVAIGAILAVPFLWFSEKVVEYCGHSNLLITAFTFYILRFTALAFISDQFVTFGICGVFEVFTLSLMWVTAVLYMRHLVPRHFTATGQAIAVIAHFCLGRFLGAVIGAAITSYHSPNDKEALQLIYEVGAVAACIIASLYFIVYHCFLKPRCLRPAGPAPRNTQPITDGPTTNGTYTPLKVYNNTTTTKGQQKGQFRY